MNYLFGESKLKEELFHSFKEYHLLQKAKRMNLWILSGLKTYEEDLKKDISNLVSKIAISNDEIAPDSGIVLWSIDETSLNNDENSKSQEEVTRLFIESRKFIEEKWKSVT